MGFRDLDVAPFQTPSVQLQHDLVDDQRPELFLAAHQPVSKPVHHGGVLFPGLIVFFMKATEHGCHLVRINQSVKRFRIIFHLVEHEFLQNAWILRTSNYIKKNYYEQVAKLAQLSCDYGVCHSLEGDRAKS